MRVLMVSHVLPTSENPGTMAPTSRQIESLRKLGVEIEILELKGRRKFKYIPVLPKLLSKVKRVDLVHAHFGYCGWIARIQWQRPVIVSFMGDDLLGSPDEFGHIILLSMVVVHINRWLARHVRAVIVKSSEMAKVVEPVQAHVVPNGVDLELFRPIPREDALETLGWNKDQDYALFSGNPDNPRKGYELAAVAVAWARPHLKRPLTLVPLRNVPPEQAPLYMNACGALLMTSYIEGSPNVVKEAMACNLPIVSVNVGDVTEMLAGVTNSAICSRDPAQVGEALERLLGCQSNGRDVLVARGLDLESTARRILGIYEQALGG
jgi:glycosyltransferase involved in cell wall biosynthesis